ncbi:hypothetical protein Zmor_008883 [Zophobas morio]|uniref:Fork-head domain-containing protein n=1 Tax=Zophobas morio TaxID=2755281 RepID=A0AA38LZ40_9CUCU|nr:hypothetical protein Zmor_008883 [Zophobas morio]
MTITAHTDYLMPSKKHTRRKKTNGHFSSTYKNDELTSSVNVSEIPNTYNDNVLYNQQSLQPRVSMKLRESGRLRDRLPNATQGDGTVRKSIGLNDISLSPNAGIIESASKGSNEVYPQGSYNNLGQKEDEICSPLALSHKQRRPPHSYASLIAKSIVSSPYKFQTLSGIYEWISNNFPYYRNCGSSSWKNCIRHNLSLNKCFLKSKKLSPGNKVTVYWSINPDSLYHFTKEGDYINNRKLKKSKALEGGTFLLPGIGYKVPINPAKVNSLVPADKNIKDHDKALNDAYFSQRQDHFLPLPLAGQIYLQPPTYCNLNSGRQSQPINQAPYLINASKLNQNTPIQQGYSLPYQSTLVNQYQSALQPRFLTNDERPQAPLYPRQPQFSQRTQNLQNYDKTNVTPNRHSPQPLVFHQYSFQRPEHSNDAPCQAKYSFGKTDTPIQKDFINQNPPQDGEDGHENPSISQNTSFQSIKPISTSSTYIQIGGYNQYNNQPYLSYKNESGVPTTYETTQTPQLLQSSQSSMPMQRQPSAMNQLLGRRPEEYMLNSQQQSFASSPLQLQQTHFELSSQLQNYPNQWSYSQQQNSNYSSSFKIQNSHSINRVSPNNSIDLLNSKTDNLLNGFM